MNNQHPRIARLIREGAIFYVSHSGGKDSQVMYGYLARHIPASQIVVVHADLGDVEYMGVKEHIENTITHPLNVVKAIWKDGSEKTLLGMVERRFETRPEAPSWPSSAQRFCTSDLKRDPIHKFIRNDLKARGATVGVNCTGLRAEESTSRAKKQRFTLNRRLTNKSRMIYEWLPIHNWLVGEVFGMISQYGQEPFWTYKNGNDRLSCVFCIMGSAKDLANGAQARPDLFAKYVELEKKTGWSMFNGRSLEEKAGIRADQLIARG